MPIFFVFIFLAYIKLVINIPARAYTKYTKFMGLTKVQSPGTFTVSYKAFETEIFIKSKIKFMNHLSTIRLLSVFFTGSLFLSSCESEHEIHKQPFQVRTATWYRISPTTPTPIVINGITYAGFAYFPGGGLGNASHLGNCTIYFNQLAYRSSPEAPPAGSVAAPVKDVPGYPVTGAPLPLIQTGDFTALSSVISSLNIPASVYQKIVNTLVYNNKGEAIFLSAITGSGTTFPISATKIGFNGKALIVTGNGRFKHAVGEVDYNGYFNVANPNDAEYNADGWINY